MRRPCAVAPAKPPARRRPPTNGRAYAWPEALGHTGTEPVGGQAVRPPEEQHGHTWDGAGAERREANRAPGSAEGSPGCARGGPAAARKLQGGWCPRGQAGCQGTGETQPGAVASDTDKTAESSCGRGAGEPQASELGCGLTGQRRAGSARPPSLSRVSGSALADTGHGRRAGAAARCRRAAHGSGKHEDGGLADYAGVRREFGVPAARPALPDAGGPAVMAGAEVRATPVQGSSRPRPRICSGASLRPRWRPA